LEGTTFINLIEILRRAKARFFSGHSSSVFRGMSILLLGTLLGRGIGVLATPIITRIYSPSDFGVMAVFASSILIASTAITLRYEDALPLPRRAETAFNLLALLALLLVISGIVISVVLWIYADFLLRLVSAEILAPWWILIPIGILLRAGYQIMSLWATRERAYKIISKTNVSQSVTGAIAKIGLGLLGFKPFGLLVGHILNEAGGLILFAKSFGSSFRRYLKFLSWRRIGLVAWHFRDYPIYRVPARTLMLFSSQAPLILSAMLYDSETTGQLALAFSMLALPVSLSSRNTAKAFYAEASSLGARNSCKIREMLAGILIRMGVLAILPTAALYFLSPYLFPIIFGSGWEQAGVFASNLAVCLAFQFLYAPASYVYYVYSGHTSLLFLNVQRAVLVVCVYIVCDYLSMSAEDAVLAYGIAISIHYAISIVHAYRFIPMTPISDQ
jgi:O-antigen/teichoic acid export membrane protein